MSNLELDQVLSLMKSHGINNVVVHFIKLQFVSGLRIGDLLSVKRNNIDSNLNLFVNQSKGSTGKVINLLFDIDFWASYRNGEGAEINLFSKSFFYKLYKRYGINISNGEGHNNTVTHTGRKMLAQNVFNATGSIEAASAALGHKKSNSTLYYLTKEQKGIVIKKGILSNPTGSNDMFTTKKSYKGSVIYLTKN